MTTSAAPAACRDAAWASFQTSMSPESLQEFCRDAERLFRINPFLEFDHWQKTGRNQFRFKGRNMSQNKPFDFETDLTIETVSNSVVIRYSSGIKNSTTFSIEPVSGGSKLTITEAYGEIPETERKVHVNKVDRSLATWAGDLQIFLSRWQRWSWCSPWRWYMRHVWQPLKPTARRIVYMLLWISLIEVALIGLGAGIYWSEYGGKN